MKASQPGAERPAVRRACRQYGAFCLLVLAAGCSGTSVDHAEVSGRVLFNGEPLPGGRVTFVATNGGFAITVNFDENGNYKIKAPVGDVQIGVDNRMLSPRFAHPPVTSEGMKKRSGAANPVTGTYVPIPTKYHHPDQSGLVYKVVKGAQTYDIPLVGGE
jgi:hypothetical protein